MARLADESLGSVVSLWRYPVKSMMGEELNAAQISDRGLLGDRAYALVDSSDGKVASAKNPRKWPRLFDFRAALVETPQPGAAMPPVRITLPDGTTVTSDEADLHKSLANVLGREVTLEAAELGERDKVESSSRAPWASRAEEYWPDIDGLDYQDTVTDFDLPAGTFFDCAVIHLLTTATIDRLRGLYPQGRFEVRRFRPNIVVETSDGVQDFVEDAWIERTVRLGDGVLLKVTGPCPRCVMTTLPQGDLPKDSGILRAAAQHHGVNVGVYASVLHGGLVRRGDAVRLD